MKKLLIVLVLLMLVAMPASASSVHLKGGKNVEPSFTDLGLALSATGELAGLGEGDVLISLTATADVTSTCANKGENPAPGQNPAPLTVTGSQPISEDELKNGNTPFDVRTDEPSPIIDGAPDCPNPNWTETIDDLAFTSATMTVEQPVGTVVLTVVCTFIPATADGAVPGSTVSCSSS